MRLIRRTAKKPIKSGKECYHGIFYCEYCDTEVEKRISNGYTNKSCGCLHRQTRHNYWYERIYKIWDGCRQRCTNKNHKAYKNYGGRGIKFCAEWSNDFLKFKNWAYQNGYSDGMEIDRIDNDGNYESSNCRFVTHAQNNRNKRTNKLNWVKVDAIRDLNKLCGVHPKELADIFNISIPYVYNLIAGRKWVYIKVAEVNICPGKCQPRKVWNKAYWNFDAVDWQCWIDSFKIFSIKDYQDHIKNVIDSYKPDNVKLSFI